MFVENYWYWIAGVKLVMSQLVNEES